MKKISFLSLLIYLYTCAVFSQDLDTRNWRKSENDSMVKAQAYYDDNLFDLAIPIFMNLQKQHPNEVYLQYVTGVSALVRSDLHELALDMLQKAYNKKIKVEDLSYNLARALHQSYKFDEAIALLEKIKSSEKKLSQARKDKIELLIVYCNNAKSLTANPQKVKIENLGSPPNTGASEYVPVLSGDEETMIYTYTGELSTGGIRTDLEDASNGRYFEDVFITHKKNGLWEAGRSIGNTVNTIEHDAAVSLSADGNTLFTFRDDHKHEGDLYVSYLQGSEWTIPESLKGEVNKPDSWEGSCSMSADGKTLYFVSDRKGGLGGRDIYKATKMQDESWGNVRNLGPKINTKYDEDAPFIHPDGKLLIFSSCGEKSMGNYDLFRTIMNEKDSVWETPVNLGYPINSPDRDSYYVLSANGERGYYSSEKEGGYGQQDIYVVSPGLGNYKPDLLIIKGAITLRGKPIAAEVYAYKSGTKEPSNTVLSNSEDGKYTLNMAGGIDYELIFKLKDYPFKTFKIEGASLKGYYEKDINIEFCDSVLIKGVVTLHGHPIDAEVIAYKSGTLEVLNSTHSNANDGKYEMSLPKEIDFELIFKLKKYPFKTFKPDVTSLSSRYEYDANIEFCDSVKVKGNISAKGKPTNADVYIYKKGVANPVKIIRPDASSGKLEIDLKNGNVYEMVFKLKGYPFKTFTVDATKLKGYSEQDINIEFMDTDTGKSQIIVPEAENKKETLLFELPLINYATNQFELTELAKNELNTKLIVILKQNPGVLVEVYSHTDAIGSDSYNMALSQRRAATVVKYLVNNGIKQARIKSKGFGESTPIGNNDTAEGRSQNRRTEFKVREK